MKTLEELLKMKVEVKMQNGEVVSASPEFMVAVQGIFEVGTHIIIHPMNHDGDTLDLLVKDNTISPWWPDMQKSERVSGA